jgi:hypothetical protein
MQMVYNSPHFYVVEYPAQDGFELIDKESGRGAFIQGPVAAQFRDSMKILAKRNPSLETVDEFLEGFENWMTQPVIYH